MAVLIFAEAKRKAADELDDVSVSSKRVKNSPPNSPEPIKRPTVVPFPERVSGYRFFPRANELVRGCNSANTLQPAVLEERNGEIEFRVVNNDNERESLIIMTGLKCIFQKQLPKMPKDYIARLVYDRTHLSIAIVKKPLEVVG